jgi:hypothetical protein
LKAFEITVDEVTEITVQLLISDHGIRVFACRFNPATKVWDRLDVTDFIPFDEFIRLQAISLKEKENYFYKLGKTKGLW